MQEFGLQSVISHLQSRRHESSLNPVTSRDRKSLAKFYVWSVVLEEAERVILYVSTYEYCSRFSLNEVRTLLLPSKRGGGAFASITLKPVHTTSVPGMIPVKSVASQNILPVTVTPK